MVVEVCIIVGTADHFEIKIDIKVPVRTFKRNFIPGEEKNIKINGMKEE